MLEILLASFVVMLVSLSGKLVVWREFGLVVERNLHFLVSFSAGVLLAVTVHLGEEIVHEAGSLAAGIPWIVIGALVVLFGLRFLPQFHHHHESGSDHMHGKIDAGRVLLSDSIHNVGDGVVIVAAFAASPFLGLIATVSIAVHEALQEISEFFVLREAGLSTRRALLYNFLASSTILIGSIGAFFLLERFEEIMLPLLGLAAGSYLTVVFHDLLPHSVDSVRERGHVLKHVVFFAFGLAFMLGLTALMPHAEAEHGHDDHETEAHAEHADVHYDQADEAHADTH